MMQTAQERYSVREMRDKWFALKLNMVIREGGGEDLMVDRPVGSAVEELTRRTPPVVGYHHRAALFLNRSRVGF